MTARVLRVLGAADVACGALLLAAAPWFADHVDAGTTAIRVAGAVLAVLGIETFLLASRPLMARATVVIEAITALLALDLVVVADPSGVGTALLAATALWCAAAAVEVTILQRTRPLVTA